MKKILIAWLIAAPFCSSASFAGPAPAALPQRVRVAIMQEMRSLSLKTDASFEVLALPAGTLLHKGRGVATTVTLDHGVFLFAGKKFKTGQLLVRMEPEAAVTLNGRTFKGDIRLVRQPGNTILVINEIDIEEYVKGIMYHEASHYWPDEALKAQAVASRTYALYQMQVSKAKDYDVTSDVYSQVYGGKTSERFRTNRAVESTRGEVISYNGKVIPAYFHATCAGHTEDASVMWDIDIPPLDGVVCDWCKDSPHYAWHAVFSLTELAEELSKSGKDAGDISAIEITRVDPSGRVAEIVFKTEERDITMTGKNFRAAMGPNIIRSLKFDARIVESDVVFEGEGWGHGVGMCQWGAYFMAKDGRSYKEILSYYYPGSDVTPF